MLPFRSLRSAHRRPGPAGLVCLVLAVACPLAGGVSAPARAAAAEAVPAGGATPADPAARRAELSRVEDEIKLSDEAVARLQADLKAIEADSTRLRQDLLDTAARSQEAEAAAAAAEARLAGLGDEETRLKASLKSRQGVLVEVIAALQRMGHHPPPALLVSPEDALRTVRTAMLLGAVLPQMREQTEALVGDLTRLAQVRAGILAERDALKVKLLALAEDRKRIDLLVDERQRALARQQRSLVTEQAHAEDLARQAASLKDLIADLERSVPSSRAAAAEAAQAPARPSLAALDDPSRLSPARAFGDSKGLLRLPVVGTMLRRFGSDDGNGGQEKGLTLATGGSATVTAPCDGWVVYAGPFRSYGQLLIINAGGGYHVVLAGMTRINVGLGQFVLAGEPVAAMASGEAKVASNSASAPAGPALYVEFRKDGVSIDPTPWWMNQGEKARG